MSATAAASKCRTLTGNTRFRTHQLKQGWFKTKDVLVLQVQVEYSWKSPLHDELRDYSELCWEDAGVEDILQDVLN